MPKIAAKDSNKNVTIAPHGTGKVVVGTGAADATLQSDGDFNLVLKTGNSTTGKIEIADGANGNIDLTPNGTGEVNISKVDIDGGAIDATDVTVGSGKTLDVSAGSLTTSTAQKQAIIDGATIPLLPSQTGNANKILTTDATDASWTNAPINLVKLALAEQSSAPDSPTAGTVYYDSVIGKLVIYNGTVWKSVAVEAIGTPILFKIWAAGGAGSSGSSGAAGSPGGYVAGTVSIMSGTTVYVIVGQGGQKADDDGRGGGGGGYSGIFTHEIVRGNALLIAGAGGGSSRGDAANGGGGGGLIGSAGHIDGGTQGAGAGKGGTQYVGGAAGDTPGNATAGSALTGGDAKNDGTQTAAAFGGGGKGSGDNSSYTTGGGGGGYYGGGGASNGGGGGGSSYVGDATSSINTQGVRVTGATASPAPNNLDSEYVAGVGMGGAGGSTPIIGGNGLVAYSYNGSSWTTLSYTGGTQTFTAA